MTSEHDGKFKSYGGKEFMAAEFPKRPWLIESLMRELDTVLLVGQEKAGKSLIAKQIICSLTSGHPFLDKFKVVKQSRVTYVQLEGEIADTQDNFRKMLQSIDFEPSLFQLIYCNSLALEDGKDVLALLAEIQKCHKPDVLIIDPLYMAMRGSLIEDVPVREFWGSIRKLKGVLGCSVIIIHHAHKLKFTRDGRPIEEGDGATYGSAFLKAYPDNTFFLAHNKKDGTRVFSCQTQRKGDIEKSIRLNLVQPDPLYFEESEQQGATDEGAILRLLQEHPEGMPREEIETKLKMSSSGFFRGIKKMGTLVEKKGRPAMYRINMKRGEKDDNAD